MVVGEGLQELVGGYGHLRESIMHLAGHPRALLLLGCENLAQKLLELALVLSELGGALCYPPLEDLV